VRSLVATGARRCPPRSRLPAVVAGGRPTRPVHAEALPPVRSASSGAGLAATGRRPASLDHRI
jgi:hypothetical protein